MRQMTWERLSFVRAAVVALALLEMTLPGEVFAQQAAEPTAIAIGVPATAELGQRVTFQARLVDSAGAPVPKATVSFTSPSTFLKANSDVVLVKVMTDREGLALAEHTIRRTEPITIRAEFPGNERYAPSGAAAQIQVVGTQQLHTEHAGVEIPGLNTPPVVGATLYVLAPTSGSPSLIGSLWPAMSGWPIAAALLIVWSLYVYVVVLVFRVAAAGGQGAGGPGPTDGRPQ